MQLNADRLILRLNILSDLVNLILVIILSS